MSLKSLVLALGLFFTTGQLLFSQSIAPAHIFKIGKGQLPAFLHYDSLRLPLISAHRGGVEIHGYPENAIETFQYTLAQTFALIECDVSMTKDSVLFLMHDNTLDRTTTGKGPLKDRTWAEIKPLQLIDDFGDTTLFHAPLFDSVLTWARGKALLTVDVKRGVPFEKVIETIKKYKVEDHVIVITYNAADARKVHELHPSLMISATIRNLEEWKRVEDTGIPASNLMAFVGTKEADPALYDLLHSKGILCILGTMGNLDQMAAARGNQVYKSFIVKGADILSTDRPFEVAGAVSASSLIPANSWRLKCIQGGKK